MKSFCRKVSFLSMLTIVFMTFFSCSNYLVELRECVSDVQASYTVEHWLQNLDGSTYTRNLDFVETLEGMALSKTQASAKEFEGFSAKKIEQQKINRDGTTVVKVYYNRNTITYTFTTDGGNWEGNTQDKTTSGFYGAEFSIPENPTKTGYTFSSWNQTVPQTFGSQNTTFTAKWAAGTGTLYKVEHLLQNIAGNDYEIKEDATQAFTGTTEAQTTAVANVYDGFEALQIEQQVIAPDGSTVVKVYYNRNQISYTFNADGGNWEENSEGITVSGLYEAKVLIPQNPSKTGYVFSEWNETIPNVFGLENKSFTAIWSPAEGTVYKVEHWQQNINDNEYTKVDGDTQDLFGTTDARTNAVAKTYPGFTVKPLTQGTIAPNGSTIIKIYYDRNQITYTFESDGGKWGDSADDQTRKGRFGADVNAPSNPLLTGYTFTQWSSQIPQTFGVANQTFTARWTPNTDTPYKIEHYQQNIYDDEYTLVDSDTENCTGTTATQTTASAKIYTGFNAQNVTQQEIAADGSTVIRINYNRKTVSYIFNPNGGNWNGNTADKTISGRYGADVNLTNPTRTGYTFGCWNTEIPAQFGANDATFTSNWNPNTNTAYKVEHWQQDVTGSNYTKVTSDTQNLTGTTATQTAASAKTYTGFDAQTITQGTIAPDGSTVIKVYYNRKTVTYTFKPNGGNWNGSSADKKVEGRYGATVSISNPTRTGYTFSSWNTAVPSVFGLNNATFTSNWNPNTNTAYKVEHYKQNVSGSGYTIVSSATQNLTGTTATQTAASAKTYTGFDAQTISQETIAPDGSTVVKVYYNRKTITYTFNSGDGKFNDNTTSKTVSGLYGATVTTPETPKPVNPRYLFDAWNTSVSSTFLSTDKTYSARYVYNYYETPEILPAGTDGTAGTGWTYVLFGVWPQTKKPENVTIDENSTITMGSHTCYLGSDKDYYYKALERAYSGNYTYSDGTSVAMEDEENPEYEYFRLEPIKWRILTNNYENAVNSGNALLLAENILDAMYFSSNNGCSYFGSAVYQILNSAFINGAFTTLAKNAIAFTKVINIARTMNPDSNATQWNDGYNRYESSYLQNNKIFLLSVQEVTKAEYGFPEFDEQGINNTRIRQTTDFAKARHAYQNQNSGLGGRWWLRSITPSGHAIPVGFDGVVKCSPHEGLITTYITGHPNSDTSIGIVPALTISLP